MADLQPSKRPYLIKDLTGRRFGKWTVLEYAGINKHQQAVWKCQCDCSKIKLVIGNNLRRGISNNCGCGKGRAVLDITGHVYGRLTVIKHVGKNGHHAVWHCQCTCGRTTDVPSSALRTGNTSSCGCLITEGIVARSTIHGLCNLREYNIWMNMKQRCLNPNNPNWRYYGGRGITMQQEWIESFQAFYDYVGPCPEGLTIERIDNERGYEIGNVKWATRKEQANNTRRNRYRRS